MARMTLPTLSSVRCRRIGAHWTDWPLAKRAQLSRRSRVLVQPGKHGGCCEGKLCTLDCDAQSPRLQRARPLCGGCLFYRGHCVRKWLPCMGNWMS